MDAPNLVQPPQYTPFNTGSTGTKVTTKSSSSVRTKIAIVLGVVGVASGIAAAVVAATSGDEESARTLIWVLLAGTGLAPIGLIIGRLG